MSNEPVVAAVITDKRQTELNAMAARAMATLVPDLYENECIVIVAFGDATHSQWAPMCSTNEPTHAAPNTVKTLRATADTIERRAANSIERIALASKVKP